MSEAPKKLWVEWPKANHLDVAYDEPPVSEHDMAQSAYTRSDLCITSAEADAMVAAERERCAQLANDQAQVFRDEAHDQMQLGHREMHKRAKMIASFFDAHASAIRKGETP